MNHLQLAKQETLENYTQTFFTAREADTILDKLLSNQTDRSHKSIPASVMSHF